MIKNDGLFTAAQLLSYLQEQLNRYYSAGTPAFAQERLEEELHCMKTAHAEEQFLLCYTLGQAAAHSGHILHVDGSSAGSLLVFLLTESKVNPLPAHYYCRHCGYSEADPSITFGLDLPAKACPHCGTQMERDGFSIPVETVWRSNGEKMLPMEYRCSEGFFSYGYWAIKEFYARRNRVVVPQGAIRSDDSRQLEPIGIFVLPEGTDIETYPQFHAYLSDGAHCFAGDHYAMKQYQIEKIILASNNIATALQQTQAASGRFWSNVSLEDVLGATSRDITNTTLVPAEECIALQLKEPSYYDMSCALTLPHNTYADLGERTHPINVTRLDDFKRCPLFCREDIFDRMLKAGHERNHAAETTEAIAYGKAANTTVVLERLGVPDDLAAVAEHCFYLFPRGSGAQRLISLMLLTRYMKEDPRNYFKAIGATGEQN